MSADAALVYLKRFGMLVSKRIAVATNNDSAYPVTEALSEAGAAIEILDMRASAPASPLRSDGVSCSSGHNDAARMRLELWRDLGQLASRSPLAAIMFSGLRSLLGRMPSSFRAHIEAAWLKTLLTWLHVL